MKTETLTANEVLNAVKNISLYNPKKVYHEDDILRVISKITKGRSLNSVDSDKFKKLYFESIPEFFYMEIGWPTRVIAGHVKKDKINKFNYTKPTSKLCNINRVEGICLACGDDFSEYFHDYRSPKSIKIKYYDKSVTMKIHDKDDCYGLLNTDILKIGKKFVSIDSTRTDFLIKSARKILKTGNL